MIDFKIEQKQFRICLSVADLEKVDRYRQSIIRMLDRIEIDDCNQELRENLTSIYELLSLLESVEDFLTRNRELFDEQVKIRCNEIIH